MTMLAGSAAASTGPAFYAPDQAGYSATGAYFSEVEVNAWLPDASRFSRELGRLGFSLEMLTPARVMDLSVYACTDASCKPGGRPVTNRYRLAFKVYNRSTHALICSTAATSCPGVPRSWNNARLSPGRQAGLVLFYDPGNGDVEAGAGDQLYIGYAPGQGLLINQARIGVELGSTPWSAVPFRAPGRETRLASFGVPAGPPYEAEFATYKEHTSCLNSWWTRHQLEMTSSGGSGPAVEARPQGLSNLGCDFGVYLERQVAGQMWPR
jgi:hypothetical protein